MATLPAKPEMDPNSPAATRNVASRLAERFPRRAEEEAARTRGGTTMQAQQLAGQIVSGAAATPTRQQITQAGAQLATQAATAGAQAGQAATQQGMEAAKLEQAATGRELGASLAERELGTQRMARENENRLASLDSQLKKEIYDDNIAFETQQAGQGVLNEVQLTDWAATYARDQEDLADKMQTMQLAQDRKLKFLEMGYKKITQELEQASKQKIQTMSYEKKVELANAAAAFKREYQRAQARKANNAAIMGSVGMIAGGVAGGMAGGPLGAQAGATAGGGLGTAAGSQMG